MKILILVTKGDRGGAQLRSLKLARWLKSVGHQPIVACGPAGDYVKKETEKYDLEYREFSYISRANPIKILLFIIELIVFLRSNKVDIIHLNSSSALVGGLAAKLSMLGVKSVFTFRGLSLMSPNYPANPLAKMFFWFSYAIFLPFIDHAIFEAHSDQEVVQNSWLPLRESSVIRPSFSVKREWFFSQIEARQKLGKLLSEDFQNCELIGSIGRLSPQKNYQYLVDAVSEMSARKENLKCVIIGTGPQEKIIADKIKQGGLKNTIFLAGDVPDASRYLKAFDIFTMTSRYEGISAAIVEALHAEVPILVSDVGGSGEAVCGHEALLYNLKKKSEYDAKLDELLKDKKKRNIASQLASSCIKQYSEQKNKAQHLKLYENL